MLRPLLLISVLLASAALSSPCPKRRLTAGNGVASPGIPAATGFEDLPCTVAQRIAVYLETPADLASMAQTCRTVLGHVQPLLQDLAPVLNRRLPDSGLFQRIRDFICKCQEKPELRALSSPQMAVGLYDRIDRYRHTDECADISSLEEVNDLLRSMARHLHPVVYTAFLWDLQYDGHLFDSEVFLNLQLPDLNMPLPQQVVDHARTHINEWKRSRYDKKAMKCIADVRGRYLAPFDRLFPHCESLMYAFAEHRSAKSIPAMLGSADVVLALLLRGVRFDANVLKVAKAATTADLCRMYPLLTGTSWRSDLLVLRNTVLNSQPVVFQRFIRIPNVVRRLRENAIAYGEWRKDPSSPHRLPKKCAISELSQSIVDRGDFRFVRTLINTELLTDFAPYLLKFCYKQGSKDWVDLILRRPEIRENCDHDSYADAFYSFVKYEKPDGRRFHDFARSKPFSAHYNTDLQLKIIAAAARTGNQQVFSVLLDDRRLLRHLSQCDRAIAKIFSNAVKGEQNDFLRFILHDLPSFYAMMLSKDALLRNSLFACILKYSSRATEFLKSAMQLPQFTDIVRAARSDGRTLLHAAFQVANLEMVELLLSCPVIDVFAVDKGGHGPFYHYLCGYAQNKHADRAIWPRMLAKLPLHEAKLQLVVVRDLKSTFSWYRHARKCREFESLLREILSAHAFMTGLVNLRGPDREPTMLHYALQKKDRDATRCLLQVPGVDVLSLGPKGLRLLADFMDQERLQTRSVLNLADDRFRRLST